MLDPDSHPDSHKSLKIHFRDNWTEIGIYTEGVIFAYHNYNLAVKVTPS